MLVLPRASAEWANASANSVSNVLATSSWLPWVRRTCPSVMPRVASAHWSITLAGMRLSLLGGATVVTCAATLRKFSNSSLPHIQARSYFKPTHRDPVIRSTDNCALWWNPCQWSHPALSPRPTHREKLPLPINKCWNVHGLGMEGGCHTQEAYKSPLVLEIGIPRHWSGSTQMAWRLWRLLLCLIGKSLPLQKQVL